MKPASQIPYYAPDGRPLGFRTLDAAFKLIEGGFVKPSFGRKGHLRAIWLQEEDGGNPVADRVPPGTRYSYREPLKGGQSAWALKRLGRGNELRPIFLQVVRDCLVPR